MSSPPPVVRKDSSVEGPKSGLDKLLGIFTEIRGGESGTALLLALNVFLLMAAYYILKPVREALLGQEEGAAEAASYLSAAMAIVLIFVVPAYAKLVNKIIRTRLITVVTLFFIACLMAFWGLDKAGVKHLGYVFFVWVGIFSVMVVAQFWGFANDIYKSEAGKRLFPIVAFGGNAGAALGPPMTSWLLEVISTFELMLVVAGMLGLCIGLTLLTGRREFEGREQKPTQSPNQGGIFDGFDLLFRYRYVGFIALLVLMLNLVNTNGEYIMRKLVKEDAEARVNASLGIQPKDAAAQKPQAAAAQPTAAPDASGAAPTATESETPAEPAGSATPGTQGVETPVPAASPAGSGDSGDQAAQETAKDEATKPDAAPAGEVDDEKRDELVGKEIGQFYGNFYFYVNIIAMLAQLFLVSRIVKFGGLRLALLILPVVALGTYGLVAALPVLAYVRYGKIAENSSDYSVNKTAVQMLFLPTSTEIKYKAKQATESFMQRAGDVVSLGVVYLGNEILSLSVRGFALINLGLIAVWLVLVLALAAQFKRIEAGEEPEISGEASPSAGARPKA